MPALNGIRLALLEARRSSEMAELVRRLGGVPYAVPAVREVSRLEDVPAFLDALCDRRFSMLICLTGVGISRLLMEAQRLERINDTLAALRELTTVCRGPKPSAVLRHYGVPVSIRAAEPHTSKELLEALQPIDLRAHRVAMLHYGERNESLAGALRGRGAAVEELCLYEWQLPDDVGALKTLVQELIDGRVHAIAVTSQIQCRHLFEVAATMGLARRLADALKHTVVVAAIGPVCAAALNEYGLSPQVVASHSKMGFLITELAAYLNA